MSIKVVTDFFKEKKGWSEIKDLLLSWYLTPYLSKVFSVASNFYFIDGFSGPGFFDDGSEGSPIIEKNMIVKSYETTKNKNVKFRLICVEKHRELYNKLVKSLGHYNWVECYNAKIGELLPKMFDRFEKNSFVFLYLDPFGIRGMPTNLESIIKKRRDIKIELLINFNSTGCYRECRRVLGSKEYDDYFAENSYIGIANNSEEKMDAFFGTHEWANIARNGKKAEYKLSILFCKKLKQSFKYVLNMPVRNIKNDEIKYRMIHCSNNLNGTVLMATNMVKRVKDSKVTLFSTDLEGNIIDYNEKLPLLMELIPVATVKTIRLNELIVLFYEKYGVICEDKYIKNYLKEKEKNNEIVVIRSPSITYRGKESTFWNEDNGKTVSIAKRMKL